MLLVQTPQQELEALEAATALHTSKAAGPRGLPIPAFPSELKPHLLQADTAPPLHAALPPADIVVLVWTSAEWDALHYVLTNQLEPLPQSATNNFKWRQKWFTYGRNSNANGRRGHYWGSYCSIKIGAKTVNLIKSDMHLNQDGISLPLRIFIRQILDECKPELILSTGTAGGVRHTDVLGDVVVSNCARFHLSDEFISEPFNGQTYRCDWTPPARHLELANSMLMEVAEVAVSPATAHQGTEIAPQPPRKPLIHLVPESPIITTDRFEFGTTSNGLEQLGCCVEMDDAVIAMECCAHNPPVNFGFVRNISDPVINGQLPGPLQIGWAVLTYQLKGLYASYNSAIAVWAMIAGA